MALIKSRPVKYRDLGSSDTVKIWCAVYNETVKTAHPIGIYIRGLSPICLQIVAFA